MRLPGVSGRVALLLWGLLQGGAVAGEPAAPAQAVGLSSRDTALIIRAACTQDGATGADRIEGTRQRGSRSIHVEVECKPHSTAHSLPVAHHTTCDNTQGAWRCDPGRQALLVTLPDQTTLPVLADGVDLRAAVQVINEAAKLTIRPFYRPAVKVMKGKCTVSETRTSSSNNMDSFQIRCGQTLIVLTRDCWDGQCRYFIPFAQNY